MIKDTKAFAENWIRSWNSHDLEQILKHYADDVVVMTPMIRLATDKETDSLSGKPAVKAYWQAALEKLPDLHFELLDVAAGVDSLALYYSSVMNKMAIEVMFFNKDGRVNKVLAHYT